MLNKTNLSLIAKSTGKKMIVDWAGKEVTLYPTTAHFGREVVECIRVRTRTNAMADEVPEDMAAEPEPMPAFDVDNEEGDEE